jgi:hypothetical protein
MVKERKVNEYEGWMEAATMSQIKEMEGFAEGLNRDREAVTGALQYEWSNGQVEGQGATRGRVSSCCDYFSRTQPDVLPSVPYRSARHW